jgi:hypothetical protein
VKKTFASLLPQKHPGRMDRAAMRRPIRRMAGTLAHAWGKRKGERAR